MNNRLTGTRVTTCQHCGVKGHHHYKEYTGHPSWNILQKSKQFKCYKCGATWHEDKRQHASVGHEWVEETPEEIDKLIAEAEHEMVEGEVLSVNCFETCSNYKAFPNNIKRSLAEGYQDR